MVLNNVIGSKSVHPIQHESLPPSPNSRIYRIPKRADFGKDSHGAPPSNIPSTAKLLDSWEGYVNRGATADGVFHLQFENMGGKPLEPNEVAAINVIPKSYQNKRQLVQEEIVLANGRTYTRPREVSLERPTLNTELFTPPMNQKIQQLVDRQKIEFPPKQGKL
jgi:hypothetical protein